MFYTFLLFACTENVAFASASSAAIALPQTPTRHHPSTLPSFYAHHTGK